MRKILTVIVLLLAASWLTAQSLPMMKSLPDLPFAHLEHNRIVYPGDSMAMERFFQKMDSVVFFGKGNLSILHLGDSHLQAGISTQRLRDNLLSIAPNLMGGQFYAFPFAAGKTNNPAFYMVSATGEWQYCRNAVRRPEDKRMGLAGAAVTTTDPRATISIISRERTRTALSPTFLFNKVTLVGFAESGKAVPVVSHRGNRLRGSFDEAQSAYVFNLPDFTDTLNSCFDTLQGSFTIQGVLLENGMDGISLQGNGVNGASVPSYLRCADFERDLSLIRPDLVILAIGTNDAIEADFSPAEFKRNYNRLIEIIHRVNPDCALLFVTNNDCYRRKKGRRRASYEVNNNSPAATLAFMELATAHHAGVWNLFDIMGGLRSMQAWENAGLAQRDKVHFTKEGYELVGDLMYNALMQRYIEHLRANARKE